MQDIILPAIHFITLNSIYFIIVIRFFFHTSDWFISSKSETNNTFTILTNNDYNISVHPRVSNAFGFFFSKIFLSRF